MSNTQRSVLGKVPSGWRVAELQDLGSWGGGKTPRKSNQEYWNGETPWVSPKDMGGAVVRRTEDHVSQVALSEKNLTVYEPGAVMVVFRSGVLRHTFPVATCKHPFTVNQDMKVLTPEGGVDNRFAFHLIDHLGPVVLQKATKVGTTVESVDTDSFMSLSVGLPPLPEQRRIADVLDTVDAAIQETDAVVEKQKHVKTGLLQDLLTRGLDANGRLRDPEVFREKKEGVLPADWRIKRVDEVGSTKIGRQRAPRYQTGEHSTPYLRVANVFDGWIDYSDVKEMDFDPSDKREYGLKPGDILLNEGQSLELVGRSAMYQGPPRKYCFQNTLIRFRAYEENDPRFCRAVFKWWLDTGEFQKVAKQTTSVAHLGGSRFAQMPFPYPPPDEQKRIGEVLRRKDDQMNYERSYRDKLRCLKTGLMQDLLTGRVRVPEAEARVDEVVA